MPTAAHFTAWLVNDTSALDQPNCDLTVLGDEISGYQPGEDGEDTETPVWTSTGNNVYYGITSVSATDGDIDDAIRDAENLLAAAGWTTAGRWEAVDNAYLITVERTDPDEEWTIDEVTTRIGAASTGSARKILSSLGITAIRREPGRGGKSVYNALQVLAARGARPGQGARTDLRDA